MKIDLSKLTDNDIQSTATAKSMGLSEHAQTMVFQMFTKNVYSNPIGTVVREIASNCFDSHAEANVKSPILIKKSFNKEDNTYYISFIDYGVGMSPYRIENIYGVYFNSTKSNTNTQIGGYGIGGKTPLAYKRSNGLGSNEYDNSFYIITNYDGIRYYYCIYEGESSPMFSLLHQEETTERNGTEVRIPVLTKDINNFSKEMIKQLYYFEDIIFEGFEDVFPYGDTIMKDYQIINANNFLYRGNDYGKYMHLVNGKVAYPIDYGVLGLDDIDYQIPVAIKFEIGEIGVTVSRESVDYSEKTIRLIKERLELAKKEIIDMLMEQYNNIVTLEDYLNVKENFGQLIFPNGKKLYLGNLIKIKNVSFTNFAYNMLDMPNDKELFQLFFIKQIMGKKPSSSYSSRIQNKYFSGSYDQFSKYNCLYFINDGEDYKPTRLKQAYLKSKHETYYIIKKADLISRKNEICDMFNIGSIYDNNDNLITIVQTLLNLQNEFFDIVQKYAVNYNEIEIPESFRIERAKRGYLLTEDIKNTTIPVTFHYSSSYNKLERVTLSDLFNYKMPIFYGIKEDINTMENCIQLFNLLFDNKIIVRGYLSSYAKQSVFETYYTQYNYPHKDLNKSIMFIQISKSNIKYMNYCKKAYHISEFKTKLLYRKSDYVKSCYQYNIIIEKYRAINSFSLTSKNFKCVNEYWGDLMSKVIDKYNDIPYDYKTNNLLAYEHFISKYFDISVKHTKEQIKFLREIDELKLFYDINEEIINLIYIPHDFSKAPKTLIDILKKVLIF